MGVRINLYFYVVPLLFSAKFVDEWYTYGS